MGSLRETAKFGLALSGPSLRQMYKHACYYMWYSIAIKVNTAFITRGKQYPFSYLCLYWAKRTPVNHGAIFQPRQENCLSGRLLLIASGDLLLAEGLNDYHFVVSDPFVVVCAKERVIKAKFTRSIHSSVWFHLNIDLVTSELTCLSQTLRFYKELYSLLHSLISWWTLTASLLPFFSAALCLTELKRES